MDRKYEDINVKNVSMICPACGAVNADGSLNCAFCGRTLVTMEKTEVEESAMEREDFVNAARDMAKNSRDFLKDFAAEVNKINETRNPNYDREASREANKNKLIIAVVIAVAVIFVGGFVALFLVQASAILLGDRLAEGMRSAEVTRTSGSLVRREIFNLIALVVMAVISVAGMTAIGYVFTKKKTTKTVYGNQCGACGANNPAGSSFCAYCGAPLTKTTSTTENTGAAVGDMVNEVAAGLKGVIVEAINKEYDQRDQK